MPNKKYITTLAAKAWAVASAALATFGIQQGHAGPGDQAPGSSNPERAGQQWIKTGRRKPQLVLKPNFVDPSRSMLANHSSHASHSSHSSHVSHRSHFSGGGGDGDGTGIVVGALVVGVIGYGIYKASKKDK
ncbi:MAG TPA: His-Xaa-Ser repeat protein HxsA2 [Puia sp.]|jgi:hypothetical protein